MQYSLTYAAIIVTILSQFFPDIPLENLHTTINTVVAIVSSIVALYGRYRAGGLTVAGFRK